MINKIYIIIALIIALIAIVVFTNISNDIPKYIEDTYNKVKDNYKKDNYKEHNKKYDYSVITRLSDTTNYDTYTEVSIKSKYSGKEYKESENCIIYFPKTYDYNYLLEDTLYNKYFLLTGYLFIPKDYAYKFVIPHDSEIILYK